MNVWLCKFKATKYSTAKHFLSETSHFAKKIPLVDPMFYDVEISFPNYKSKKPEFFLNSAVEISKTLEKIPVLVIKDQLNNTKPIVLKSVGRIYSVKEKYSYSFSVSAIKAMIKITPVVGESGYMERLDLIKQSVKQIRESAFSTEELPVYNGRALKIVNESKPEPMESR
jgi:hypothetical protein